MEIASSRRASAAPRNDIISPMFSSLRSRLWLSYALLIVTALGIVAVVLFISLLRNPLLYRQTTERLKAVQTVVMERESDSQSQPISVAAQKASRTFDVRVLLYSKDRQLILDTYSDNEARFAVPGKEIDSAQQSDCA